MLQTESVQPMIVTAPLLLLRAHPIRVFRKTARPRASRKFSIAKTILILKQF